MKPIYARDNTETVKLFIGEEAGDDAVETNLGAASEVLSYLPPPETQQAATTGLLLGRIQAGKTMAIISTIALAADNGYRVFVVLTSDNVWLRKQTQDRLSRALPGLHFPDDDGFDLLPKEEISGRGAVFVCTKNADNLRHLLERLNEAGLGNLPAIIVDDEADQASLDTKARIPGAAPSTINTLITELRSLFRLSVFLQVTATPNALVLQPAGHEFRPEFVVVLEPGTAYVGGSILFDEEGPYIRSVELEELLSFLSLRNGMPSGLKRAITTFLVAATIQHMFGPHRSFFFLCHVSHLKDRHDLIRQAIDPYLNEISTALAALDAHQAVIAELEGAYRDVAATVPSPPEFELVLKRLLRNIPSRDIQVLNADSDATEPRDNRIYNFLIGGNRLGRGVTIKRLLVTYYGRAVKKPQMDTMQQHARMYGYRRQELNVIRIFVPADMAERFRVMDEADTALRELIRSGDYRGIEPLLIDQGMRATRNNVLAGDVGFYVAGKVYSPQFPLYLPDAVHNATADLDRLLAPYNPGNKSSAPADVITTDDLIRLIRLCRSEKGHGGWEDARIAAALETLNKRFPVSYLVVRRDRNLSKPAGRLRDPGTPQDRPLRRADGPTLWMYRQNGMEWAGVPFWIPRLQLPDGRYAIAFSLCED